MARRKDRSERDRAGVGPEPHRARQLVPLNDLDGYDFAEGDPDIRGWDVCTVNGHELGEVEDLLVDPDRREVVMLDVDLRDEGVRAEVPIRDVQLDRNRKVVLIDSGDIDRAVQYDDDVADRGSAAHDEPRRDYRGNDRTGHTGQHDDRDHAERQQQASAAAAPDGEEVVIERRPVVEEVVVRRRVVDEE